MVMDRRAGCVLLLVQRKRPKWLLGRGKREKEGAGGARSFGTRVLFEC